MARRWMRTLLRVSFRLLAICIVVELVLHAGIWPMGPTSCVEPDPETGWRVRPNLQLAYQSDDGPYLLETNSLGLRGIEHSKEKDGGVYRIVVQGACGTFGLGIAEQDSYVSKIEEFLPKSETVNLGNIGFCATQQFVQLTDDALEYKPDLVIQFLIEGDERSVFYPWVLGLGWKPYLVYENDEVVVRPPTPSWFLGILEKTHLPMLASRHQHLLRPLYPEGMPSNEERFKAMALLLLKTREICHQAGADYLPVFVPAPEYLQVYDLRGTESYVLIPRLFDYLGQEQYLTCLNMMDPLLDAMKDKSLAAPYASGGDRNLTKRGHEVVAQSVADAVRSLPRYQAHSKTSRAVRHSAGSRF